MASNLVIPFDNNPASVTVVTTSYTVPAGKYARILAECDSGGIVTVNGSSAITSSAFINVGVSSGFAGGQATYSVPSGYRFDGQGTSQVAINNISYPMTANGVSAFDIHAGPGGTANSLNSSAFAYTSGVASPSNATNRQGEMFVPTGTVISGSGSWRAVVMLYNVIS